MPHSILIMVLLSLVFWPSTGHSQCPPEGYTVESLLELKAAGFELDPEQTRNDLAARLVACTGHPDPDIRDGVVYSGLSQWLRGEQLFPETVMTLMDKLIRQLAGDQDSHGFRKPFAALVLSEVVRTDRVSPAFSDEQRQLLVDSATAYLQSVDDYRGFSDNEGWRHGVAHGADLALQLVLNPAITASQVEYLLGAVARQVAPGEEVFYVYGEPARLARPVFYAQQREMFNRDWWASWLEQVTDPAPLGSWDEAWSSNAGLAKRHNTLAFLVALHFNAVNSGNEPGEVFASMVIEAIKRL